MSGNIWFDEGYKYAQDERVDQFNYFFLIVDLRYAVKEFSFTTKSHQTFISKSNHKKC